METLSPKEVAAAILQAVERNIAIGIAEFSAEVASMVGYRSASSDLRKLVASCAQQLVGDGMLQPLA